MGGLGGGLSGEILYVCALFSVCDPLCSKTCAVRPVFGRVVGKLGAADPRICRRALKANARPGAHYEAPGWSSGGGVSPAPRKTRTVST